MPGLSEMWECVQIHGAPTDGRISVTVARPLRSNFLPSGCRPVERKINAPIAISRSGDITTSSVEVSKRKSSIEGQTERHCSRSSCGLRGHHLDLGAEGDGVLGEHVAHRLEIDVGDVAAPAGIPIGHRTPVLLRHGQPLHRCSLSRFAKLNVPPSAMLRLRPCRRSTARLRLPAPRTWPSRCASIRRGWRPIWRGRCRALPGRSTVQPVQGRAVQPDLSAGNPVAQIRAAAEAAGQAAAVGACGRSRIPRHPGAAPRKRFPVAEPVLYCADESVTGTPFYVMGFVEGRVFWNPEMPGSNPARARGDLRRDGRDAWRGCIATIRRGSGLSDFGRGENYVARQVDRWSKQYRASQTAADRRDGAADRMAAGAYPAVRPGAARAWRLPARQHDLRHGLRRGCWRCSTGSCRRSAIRWPTSATT